MRRSNFAVNGVPLLKFWFETIVFNRWFHSRGVTSTTFLHSILLNVLLPDRLTKRKILNVAKSPQITNITAYLILKCSNVAGILLLNFWSMKTIDFIPVSSARGYLDRVSPQSQLNVLQYACTDLQT